MVQYNTKTIPEGFLTKLWNSIPCLLSQCPKVDCGHYHSSAAIESVSWHSSAKRRPCAQEVACSGGHVRCGEWMVRAALCLGWAGSPQTCVQGRWWLLSFGLPLSKSQFRTKEQTLSFPAWALAMAIGVLNLDVELQAMCKLILLIDLCFRHWCDKTWAPGHWTASYNRGMTREERKKRSDSICAERTLFGFSNQQLSITGSLYQVCFIMHFI